MKHLPIALLTAVALCWTGTAAAQYGLYGSPEMLPLRPANPTYQQAPSHQAYAQPYPTRGYAVQTAATTPKPADASPSDASSSNLVDQMLMESGSYPGSYAPGGYGCGACEAPQLGYQCGTFGRAVDQGCTSCSPAVSSCGSLWYASSAGLIMDRNLPNRLWTTYETGNNPNQLMNTQDIGLSWTGGWEVTLGRYFCCNQYALEITYWGIAREEAMASMTDPNAPYDGVSTPLSVSGIEFDDGVNPAENAALFFDNAGEHRLWREYEVHNVEINLLRKKPRCDCEWVTCNWMLGARWFRFEEELRFGSLAQGNSWGDAGGIYEAYLRDQVENDLLGFQFGCDIDVYLGSKLRLFANPRVGIYNNHVEHMFTAYRGDGLVAQPTAASGVTGSYPVESESDNLAFLSEIDLGLDYQLTPRLSAFVGYRVVFVTGVALADNQIPPYIVDIPELADNDTNGDLVLHGAFAGATFEF